MYCVGSGILTYQVLNMLEYCASTGPSNFEYACLLLGGIPVAVIKGRVMRESNDIMQALEEEFPEYNPMLPRGGTAEAARVHSLLKLEVI